ncbi:SixA phosphatase family protein [Aegicerativicinus sediminis]|uniref:SixA phosphatase family protein n=1 Tax=Aegicerativicinus sediminis TaxID=2893202 RepID=UPI001E4D133F|nr:histidine phosphatase family protein [Aegicerativicinus sediminis]
MKILVLVRHAKSSWEHDVTDIKRPLKGRGVNDAKLVSQRFKEEDFMPERVFSSPANRAFSTCKIFMDTLGVGIEEVTVDHKLYDFSGENILGFIKSMDNKIESAMIFGHNFALTNLVNSLGSQYIGNFPTSGLAKIHFDIDTWENISKGSTNLLLKPKDLK